MSRNQEVLAPMVSDAPGAGLQRTATAGWSVRAGRQADRQAIERIWSAQFDDASAPSHQQTLDECLDPDHDLFEYSQTYVATDGRGRVVAFGLVTLRNAAGLSSRTRLQEAEFSGRDGYLPLSAVADGWKQRGIGTRLFAERVRWCAEQNANGIYGVAWQNPDGPTSDPLFQKFGFEEIAPTPDDYYAGRDCAVCDDDCDCTGIIYRREL